MVALLSRKIFAAALLMFLAASTSAHAQTVIPVTVMTYNIRFASDQQPNAWNDRRALVGNLIKRSQPDIIGTQEGVYSQLNQLAEDLKDYAWIGLGRDGGSRGEFMAVFYRKDRFESIAFDHFWLSDTPALIASSTWGNRYNRMVTWVQFREKKTGREFYFWNTHFDHEIQQSREKSAALLRQRIQALPTPLPLILTGDFNAPAGQNSVYTALLEGGFLRDSWTDATKRVGEEFGTFNDFGKAPQGGARIDWILVRGSITVDSTEILTERKGEQYPSDHYPVIAKLRL